MVLKPQDLIVVLKYQANRERLLSTGILAAELGLSLSEVSSSIRRSLAAQLLAPSGLATTKGRPVKKLAVNRAGLRELLLHGVRYVFIAERGKLTRGIPTAHGASPLREVVSEDGPLPVWPHPKGLVRGEGFAPLHRCAIAASQNDEALYALLALVDGVRSSSARVREVAAKLLSERIERG